MELMKANQQWMTRPSDERFTSLDAMLDHFGAQRARSNARTVSSRAIQAGPVDGDDTRKGLALIVDGQVATPNHWAFGQLCDRANAPAGYLRRLPADLTADLLNFGIRKERADSVGMLSVDQADGSSPPTLTAATGPNYGRVWNDDVVRALIERFGNGVDGKFRVPGTWGRALDKVTLENTTLFGGERDMFVFLADEVNRIELPNRRGGQAGSLARGFFVWNSEVGSQTLGIGSFLFDYVCGNRIVWGAEGYHEIRVRHSKAAPDRFLEEVGPALITYAESETVSITSALTAAQAARIDDVDAFLTRRFTRDRAAAIKIAHDREEGRPIETIWDVVTGATAYAKGISWQDDRVAVEREAGKILSLVK